VSVFRRRLAFRTSRETPIAGSLSLVTATTVAAIIVFAGTALGSTTASTGEATGAIVIGGGTVASITVEVSGTGAIAYGGTATGLRVSNGAATGAVALGGTARSDLSGTGAISVGGSATVGSVFTMDASGALVFAGTAAPVVASGAVGAVAFGATVGAPDVSGGVVESAASGAVALAGDAAGVIGAAENVPDQFYIEAEFGVEPGSLVTSKPITVQGNSQPATLLIEDGEYSVNGGAFTDQSALINAGAVLVFRHTAADTFNTPFATSLTLSGIGGQFVSVTRAASASSRTPRHRRAFTTQRRRVA
jgi:hypothetical protein